MTDEIRYPYELKNAFFTSVKFHRAKEVPQPIELPVETEVGISERKFPVVQIAVKVRTPDDTAISFDLHMVGIFEYQGEKKDFDRELEVDFALERGVPSLWSYLNQMVRITTSQMGVSPLNLRTPLTFGSREELLRGWNKNVQKA
jgi:preprotein translocase subunit SecB